MQGKNDPFYFFLSPIPTPPSSLRILSLTIFLLPRAVQSVTHLIEQRYLHLETKPQQLDPAGGRTRRGQP
jgi:hypothetical protein